MPYTKITATLVVSDDELEPAMQSLGDALSKIEQTVTSYGGEIETAPAPKPENADEIGG